MHRAAGRYQGWKFNSRLVGLNRNPWIHLSDPYIQGTSCAKNTPPRVEMKKFFQVESVICKPCIPSISVSDSAESNANKRRVVSTASVQSRGNAKGKRADRNSQNCRHLKSKSLMESAFQVLRDIRNANFTMGLFRFGPSALSEKNPLSSHSCKHSAETEFEWSSALWQAEVSNAAGDEVLMKGSPVQAETNPADQPLDRPSGTDGGSRISVALLNGAQDPSLNNAFEAENIDWTTEIAVVNVEPPVLWMHDSQRITSEEQKIQNEDAGGESRNVSDHHSQGSPGADVMDTTHTLEEIVLSSSCEPTEDGCLALLTQTGEESTRESEMDKEMERLKELRETGAYHAYPVLSIYDTYKMTSKEQKIQEEDARGEFRNISDLHSEGCTVTDVMNTKHTLEEIVLSSSWEPSEDGGLARLTHRREESTGESETHEMERVRELRITEAHHAYRYNTFNDPFISDSAYDELVEEMKQVEDSTVGMHDSAVPIVGAPPPSSLLKVQHTVPMLSLASVQKEEELVLWHQRLQERLGTEQKYEMWVVEPKLDGLGLSLRYENGKLVCASTQGNGFEGEDVTHNTQNVRNIPSVIPQQLPGSSSLISSLEVRGHIYLPAQGFAELNAIKSGEVPFANQRTAATAFMRLLSSQNLDTQPLSFLSYSIVNIALTELGRGSESTPPTPSNQWEALQILKSLGFFVNEDNQIFYSFNSALEYAKSWMNKRHSLGYKADGVVFKINDRETKSLLASEGGDPCWAVGWKFPATEVVTVLEAVQLTVGRTGVIVPNAHLKPVELGGVSIRHAPLRNFKLVKDLGLCEGDHVIVQRAGDVIPQILQPLEELRQSGAHPWVPPTQCPSCGSDLTEESSKGMVFCRNSDCSSRLSRQVEHFAKVLISGLGPKILNQLQEEGLVVGVADLYSLNEEAVSVLPRFGKKSARKLLNAIEESKGRPDWEFIAALGIPRVGVEISQRLNEHIGGLRGLLDASDDELQNVPGVREQTLKAVLDWCRCESNIGLVSALLAAGCTRASSQVNTIDTKVSKSTEMAVSSNTADQDSFGSTTHEQPDTIVECGAKDEHSKGSRTAADRQPKLLGKVVVVTGSFGPLPNHQYIHELVRSHGGITRSTVTSKTSFLLAGVKPGQSKIAACKKLGIDILGWERFESLLKDP